MRYCLVLLVIVGFTFQKMWSQERLYFEKSCGYTGEITDQGVYGFASDSEAQKAMDRIMRYTGLPSNFTIKAANVPNAAAVIQSDRRLILYNQYFMERVKGLTNTDWAALSILAHEIGHHLSGHTLDNVGSRPDKELEADRFSGFVLFKMGATLDQARVAMATIAGDQGSATHPPKSARLAAITNGWMSARDLDEQINPIGRPSASPTTRPSRPDPPRVRDEAPKPRSTYSVHSMLHATGGFPELREEWASGRYFLDGFKYLNRWNVITGPKPANYDGQVWRTRRAFPDDEIKELWEKRYRITTLRYVEDVWLLVMTRFDYNPGQRWRKRSYFPEKEIEEGWKEGFYISDMAFGEESWVVVLDKKPDSYVGQEWRTRKNFPKDEIKELWDRKFNITTLRYLDDRWVLVMTKFDEFKHQLWRTRTQFPKQEIIEQEARGYRVSELSYGNGVWSLVMTKEE